MSYTTPGPPTFEDIEAAAARIAGRATVTPLLNAELLDAAAGRTVFVKAECLQRTGSFKFRGAFNRISQIPRQERGAGVIAFSSGNHAQGVAAAARLLDVPATILMPSDAPRTKLENTRQYGAVIQFYDRNESGSREAMAQSLAEQTGATLVRPFDDPGIIAGQGTVGLEIAAALNDASATAEAVLVPIGGGGLTAGIALALARLAPGIAIHPVEPTGFDDWARSLKAGRRVRNAALTGSICDALMAPEPGELTYAINKERVGTVVTVDDDETRHAMREAFRHLKVVLEPGGAVALAAVLAGKLPRDYRSVIVVASGGNVDAADFCAAIARG